MKKSSEDIDFMADVIYNKTRKRCGGCVSTLEGRVQIMCNWSQCIEERAIKTGIAQGIAEERIGAIERMIRANATKEQIISYGYTEAEYEKAESALYANA